MKVPSKTVFMAIAFSAASSLAFAQGGATGGATGGGTGGAEGGAAGGSGAFSQLDQDGNGYIDEKEASGISGLDMQSADTDGDGQLSRTEFEAAMQSGGSSGSGGGMPGAGGSSGSDAGGSSGSGSGTR
ncbi:MAG TPA: EF-hand domain-containing protein [Burkholderiales bacterium]